MLERNELNHIPVQKPSREEKCWYWKAPTLEPGCSDLGSCCLCYSPPLAVSSWRQQGRDEIILLFARHQAKKTDPLGYSIQFCAAAWQLPVTALSRVGSGLCSPQGDSKSRRAQASIRAGVATAAGRKRRPRIANI